VIMASPITGLGVTIQRLSTTEQVAEAVRQAIPQTITASCSMRCAATGHRPGRS